MSKPYLEITYRQGKPFAAYLYLDRRADDKVARTERHAALLADFSADGRLLGIEFAHVGKVDLAEINGIIAAANQTAISIADLTPLQAA